MESRLDEGWRANRDRKMFQMLDPDEPAWMVEEEVRPQEEVVRYAIVHRWKPGGWARRRYTYDTVGDVIHFRGTSPVEDNELAKMKPEQRIAHHNAPR